MKNPATRTRPNGSVRCAIYTRKSSEEGLEQEFNSLQAQREAFITSQRHEGWMCLPECCDDGGFSDATMANLAQQYQRRSKARRKPCASCFAAMPNSARSGC